MPEEERKGFPDFIPEHTDRNLMAMRYAQELNISALEVEHVPGDWLTDCRTKWAWEDIQRKESKMKG